MNTQLEAIALHCRSSKVVAELQLALAWRLQSRFRTRMPSCIVIPFGAPFSGHGTVSSDCDLCVLLKPHPLDIAKFSGPTYLPPDLLASWEQLQATPPPAASSQGELCVHRHSTRSCMWYILLLTEWEQSHELQEPGFDGVLTMVREDQHCSHVLPLPHAHCPIIRFLYEPHQLHCDLSVNNRCTSCLCNWSIHASGMYAHYMLLRLGPANTQLLAAYMNFDLRMAVLVPCVRLWARAQGLKRKQINSYALSLMLVHSLQHTSPPVLPCLQVGTPCPTLTLTLLCHRNQGCGLRIWNGSVVAVSQLTSLCSWMDGIAPSQTLALSFLLQTLPQPVAHQLFKSQPQLILCSY